FEPALRVLVAPPFTQEALQHVAESLVQQDAAPFLRLVATLRASANADVRALGQALHDASQEHSVTWEYDYDALAQVIAELVKPIITLEELQEAQNGLVRHDVGPLLHVVHTLQQHDRVDGEDLYAQAQDYLVLDASGSPLPPTSNYQVFARHFEEEY